MLQFTVPSTGAGHKTDFFDSTSDAITDLGTPDFPSNSHQPASKAMLEASTVLGLGSSWCEQSD